MTKDDSRFWSPPMRRWAKDSRSHGMPLRLTGAGSSIQPTPPPFGLTNDADLILLTDETSGFTLTPG